MEVTYLNLVLLRTWTKITMKGGGSKEGSNTFMAHTNCQRIEDGYWAG